MQSLIQQERFEIEVLDRLNSARFLNFLVFYGGTMLRLCHGLDRFSVDLDFRMTGTAREKTFFQDLHAFLSGLYSIRDAADKFHTLIFEFRSPAYPRTLKIEIRKRSENLETEQAIAYSPHSTRQVLVQTVTLREMMSLKTAALVDRGEIRDAYDMEFLVKRGIGLSADRKILEKVLRRIESFTKTDYRVKLGSLIGPEQRAYYREHNFRILKAAIQDRI
jgi:predicted nucleotidyltransferase component of viral defense system